MSDEFLRRQEADYQNLSRAGQQLNNQLAAGFGRLLGQLIRMMLQHGGIYMEMFLRFNFGVGYFPPFFSLCTTAMFGTAIYFSAQTLFVSPAVDPETLKTASGVLISSVILSIPWTIHCLSIMWRYSDSEGRASDSNGDSWLDVLNAWLQRRHGYVSAVPRRVVGWLCAREARRDFLGETIAGIAIAYLVGWVSFYHHVTAFLLSSLFLMQIKRACRYNQAVQAERQRNDTQTRMARRN